MNTIVLFEPPDLTPYGPLTLLRTLGEIQFGVYTNIERCLHLYPDHEIILWVRPELQKLTQARYPDVSVNRQAPEGSLFLHAGMPAWLYPEFIEKLEDVPYGNLIFNDNLVAARSNRIISCSSSLSSVLQDSPKIIYENNGEEFLPFWLWDYLDYLPTAVEMDVQTWKMHNEYLERIPQDISLINDRNIYIHKTARISKFVHLDASLGPIVIDADVSINPFVSLTGPLFIGKQSTVKSHSLIHFSVIGKVCNVAGEINNSIMQAFSNKSHDGYLGHSMLGSWVNLGAGTTTSNLKNNYHSIKVSWEGNHFDTDRQFLGAIIGDHTKTAIGVRLNTGTVIGVFCNVFQSDFPPRLIPSFSWGNGSYDLDKALDTAARMAERRNRIIDNIQLSVIRRLSNDLQPFLHW